MSALSWEQMQALVTGLLRLMGYKTRIFPAGPDKGRDIVASPDGFGFEKPRIVVEVQHHSGAMEAQPTCSFPGGAMSMARGCSSVRAGLPRMPI